MGAACLALVVGVIVVPDGMSSHGGLRISHPSHSISSTRTTTLANAPASLRAAVQRDLASGRGSETRLTAAHLATYKSIRQLGATYTPNGAQFKGSGFEFSVGRGSVGRGSSTQTIGPRFLHRTSGATYGQGTIKESFRPTEAGVEQSFQVTSRISGSGPLEIDVPVSGLLATADGSAIDLRDTSGRIQATYSRLRVTDTSGKAVPATMRAASHGDEILLEIHDTDARYPLRVDPTWSQVAEFTASDGAVGDMFGYSVAISGTTAVVGAPITMYRNPREGAAYVFTSSGNTWTQVAEFTAADGAENDEFGESVAISGTTAIVGAWGHTVNGNTAQGAVYVFSLSGGTWTQSAEFTSSDGAENDEFGQSVAISGTTAIVGAHCHTVNGNTAQGAAYVFSLSGGTWTQSAELTSSDGAADDNFGYSVAISSTTAIVGAIGRTVNGNAGQGAAYVFSSSGNTWTQSAELTSSDGAENDYFGYSVAISGTTAIVGTRYRTVNGNVNQGAAYVFSSSGNTWTQSAELTSSDGATNDDFGHSVAISGTTAIVGAFEHTVNGDAQQGAAYVFNSSGNTWTQSAELTSSDGAAGDSFGTSVALSGTTVVVGAPYHIAGMTYVFTGPFVQPQGSGVGADAWAGGSPSESCQNRCTGATTSSRASVADPVDAATGDIYETSTDLSLPGAGVPLAFTRTYDAQAAQVEVSNGSPAPPLGYGWSYGLGMSLAYNSTTEIATITEENGAQTTFTPYVSGTSPAWCSAATNFCATAPRIEATLNQNPNGTWTYVRTTGGQETFTFSAGGVLAQIADSSGNTLSSAAYSPGTGQTNCPSSDTCVAWTSSASGRELVLAFDSSGQLTSVFDANSTLAANFSFSGSSCTTWGGSQTPDLCTATDPGNLTTAYTYDSGNSTASFDYDMLTETPPGASGHTTNVYNSSGQISQQTDPSGAVITLSYSGTNSSLLGGTTTVTTYPLGTGSGEPQDETVYQYSSNVLVGETTGAGTSSASTQGFNRDPVSLLALSVQDGDGNISSSTYQTYSGTGGTPVSSANLLSSSDAVGNTTQNAYNSFNQAWCSVDAADYANGALCPTTPPSSPPSPGSSDPDLGMTISFYNSSDQLTAQTDALGNTTTYSYSSGVSGVPNGLQYCSVDPVSYQKGVTCPAYGAAHVTGTTTHTFDSAGDTLTSTDADGNTTTYVYNATGHPGLVSSQSDPDGTTTSYTYNGSGEVTTQVVTFGSYSATTLNAYDTYGRKYCSVAPYEAAKGVTCPSSPPSSPPTPSNDPYTGATITTYDSDGRVIQVTNSLGGITYTAYDQAGEAFCSVAPYEAAKGVTCPFSPPSSPPTPTSDPYAGATITTYDPNGRVIQVTNPLGGITLTTYDGAGNVIQTTVESNNGTTAPNIVTTNSYDADNRVVSTTVGSGSSNPSTTLTSYDPNGDAFCTVSAKAYAAGSSAYQCPTWQASWISTPPSPSALYSTTPTSAQANNVTTSFFDANGDQVQTTNPDVQTSVTAVDADGRTYCTSDATNVSTWLSAHPSGTYPYLCPSTPPSIPPAQGSNPGYFTTIFDAAGRMLSSTDQAGDTTATTYDPAGHALTTTDPRGKVTTNCYYFENASGQCAVSAPAGGGSGDDLYSTTTPATSADPSGETTTYTYYPGDETDLTTTPAGKTTDTYDALLDLTAVTYSNTASGYSTPTNVSYTYYTDGSRDTMTDATGTTTYTYDSNGDVTSQALVAGAGSGLANTTTSYGYFTTGVLSSVTYPSYSGHTNPAVTYSYDALGNMASETDWLGNEVAFTHDQDGNLSSQDNAVSTSNPSGTSSTAFSYDNADQNTQASSTLAQTCGGNETLTQAFSGTGGSRNPDDQLSEYTDSYTNSCSGQGSYERNYSYDTAGRVVYQGSSSQGSASNNFAYDPSGDPTTISSHDTSGNLDTYTQAFDSAGEVTSQTPNAGSHGVTSTYSYDTLGDQTQTTAGSTSTTYAFNQAGQMTSAASASGPTTYLYTGAGLEALAATPVSNNLIWGPPTDVDSTRAIDAVQCVSSSFCVAVGASGYVTIYNGSSWSTPTDADSTRTLDALSCVSSSFCVAVDTSGYATIYNGSSWSTPTDIDSTRSIDAVKCVSSSFCVAVGASGYVTIYNGSSWSTPTDADSTRTLDALSCVSSSFCVAVDTSGYAAKYNGSTWTATDIDSTRSIDAVQCVSSSFCVAAGASGYATVYNGSSWSTPTDADSSRTIKAVSCPTSSLCVAVDTSGYATVYNGSSWSTPTDIDGSHAFQALSCASSSFCEATDNAGNVLTYNGSSWSAAQDIDAARTISSVSCTSSTFCAAVDSSGYATVYRFVTLTSQFTWDTNGSLSLVLSDGINDYIYGPGTTPVEEVSISSSTPSYMTYTPADSSWLITNAAGDEIAFYGYDAFGNLAFGTPASPFGYAGQYTDPSTGFSDLRARWYEGQTGNFTTRDPAFASTDSAYTYAGDDPVNGIDPMGMSVNLSGAAQWAQGDASPGDNNGFRDDCTDFVSRALHIGGGDPETYSWDFAADLAHKHDPYYWFQVQDLLGLVETSSTWANARDLFAHFIDNGSSLVVADFPLLSAKSDTSGCEPSNAYALPYGIQAGDVIFVNWSGSNPSGIGHAGIVIYVESGQLWIAQHTPNRIDTLTKWASGGSDPFIWIFDPNEG